jgi:S1-C subfamily serine protease
MSGQPAGDAAGQPDGGAAGQPGYGAAGQPDGGAAGQPGGSAGVERGAWRPEERPGEQPGEQPGGRQSAANPPSPSWRRRTGALLPGKWAQPVATPPGPTVAQPRSAAVPAPASAQAGAAIVPAPSRPAGETRFVAGADGTVSAPPGADKPPAGRGGPAAGPGRESAAGGTGPGRRNLGNLGQKLRGALRGARRGELRGKRRVLAAVGLALACTILGGVVGGFIVLRSQPSPVNPSYSLGTVPPALTARPASSVAGIAARVTPSVVMIKVNGGEGTGSGFIIKGGYIMTDNHVVTLDNQVTNASLEVYFSNGQSAPAQVVGRDPFSDIAVLRAEGVGGDLPALTLGNSAGVDVGDPVIAVGSPLGLADTVTSGIVSAVDRPVQPGEASGTSPQVYFDAIQTDAPINPGNSGGPLVNARGQVIGIDAAIDTLGDNPLTGTQGGSIGLGFAIPINQARRVTVELIRTGHATHAVIGAVLDLGWGGNGAQIAGGSSAVTPGGPAARAGLQPGDVITRFEGQPVGSAAALLDAVRSTAPGSQVRLTFSQNGRSRTVTMRLGSAPS